MATATALRSVQKIDQESSVSKILVSKEKMAESTVNSTLLVKKLLALGFSEIAYGRLLYPEDNFIQRNLDGNLIHLMRTNEGENSCSLGIRLKHTFDALDKKYVFQNGNESDVLESYTFSFKYQLDEVICEFYNTNKCYCTTETYSETTEAAKRLLDRLQQVLGSMPPLPDDVQFKFRIGYRQGTPDDYEPKGFRPIDMKNLAHFNKPSSQINFGDVTTVTCSTSLAVRTVKNNVPTTLPEGLKIEDAPEPTDDEPENQDITRAVNALPEMASSESVSKRTKKRTNEVIDQNAADLNIISETSAKETEKDSPVLPKRRRVTRSSIAAASYPNIVQSDSSNVPEKSVASEKPRKGAGSPANVHTVESYPGRVNSRKSQRNDFLQTSNTSGFLEPIEERSHQSQSQKSVRSQVTDATSKAAGEMYHQIQLNEEEEQEMESMDEGFEVEQDVGNKAGKDLAVRDSCNERDENDHQGSEDHVSEVEITSPIMADEEIDDVIEQSEEDNDGVENVDIDDVGLRCQCGIDFLEHEMLTCHLCGSHMHMGCYGYPTANDVPAHIICYTCARGPLTAETRQLLETIECNVDPNLNEKQAQELCLMRIALMVAAEVGTPIDSADLCENLRIDSRMGNRLMRRLLAEGYLEKLPPRSRSKKHAINVEQIQTVGLTTYFREAFNRSQTSNTTGRQEEEYEIESELNSRDVSEVDVMNPSAADVIVENTRRLSLRNNTATPSSCTDDQISPRTSSRQQQQHRSQHYKPLAQSSAVINTEADTPVVRLSGHFTPLEKASKAAKKKQSMGKKSQKKGK